MRVVTKIGTASVALLVGYAVLSGMTPLYHENRGTNRDPESVTLDVKWGTGGGVEKAGITWTFTGEKPHQEVGHGGTWRRDIRLPGPGSYVITLTGTPTPVQRDDGKGGTFRKSATATCTVTRAAGVRTNVHPAVPGEGCRVTDVVVVP